MKTIQEDFLYHRVADRLAGLIEDGVLKSGDKLLSVRALSEEQGISLSTAFKAYAALESKGLIEARPKSGYYVRFTSRHLAPMLRAAHPHRPAQDLTVDEMIAEVYANISETGVVRMSLAAPAVELLPAAKLNKCVVEALRKSPTSCLAYESVQGNESLRQQIARHLFNWGGRYSADDVLITQGSMHALSLCLQAITQPGDTVAVEQPSYFGIFNLLKSLNLKALEIPVDPVTGIDLDYLKQRFARQKPAACLFVPNFNNPVGCLMPDANKKALVHFLTEQNIPLVEDDIYGELYFGKIRPHSCKHYDTEGIVLYCSSFSKSLAPGYRIGWCLPGKHKAAVQKGILTHSITAPTLTQAALARFCETGRFDLHLRHLRKALYTQCLRYSQSIAAYFPPETRVSRPLGGYVLWVELDARIDAFELHRRARQHHIHIAPGRIFSVRDEYRNYFRLGFGTPFSSDIEQSIKTLGVLVRGM